MDDRSYWLKTNKSLNGWALLHAFFYVVSIYFFYKYNRVHIKVNNINTQYL